MIDKQNVPVKYLPHLLEHLDHLSSLFAIYERQYGFTPRRVKSSFQAKLPRPQDALALRIPAGMPVLKVESLLKFQDDLLIQYTIGWYRSIWPRSVLNGKGVMQRENAEQSGFRLTPGEIDIDAVPGRDELLCKRSELKLGWN
jgi:hypothetical protein